MRTQYLAASTNPLLPDGTFIVELLIFIVVLIIMWRAILPPILKALQERADRVTKTAEQRQEATDKLAAAEARYEEALKDARKEAGDIRGEARVEGQQTLDEVRTQANTEVAAIRRRADEELAEQRERAMRELHGHIGELGVALAGRIVGEDVSGSGRQAETVTTFLDGITAKGEA